MTCHLEGRILNIQRATSLVDSLTIHYHPHILDKMVDNLKNLRRSYPSLVLCESIQPLEHRLNVLLSKKLLSKFFCVVSSQVALYLTKDGLTRFTLLDLFGNQREGRQKLHKYLDDYLSHSDCRRDPGIDVEAIQKIFDRLKQIDQGIIAVNGTLDRLIRDVTKMRTCERKKAHTENRIARPVCIAATGGKCYRMTVRDVEHLISACERTRPIT
jgi:hypothetical protein